MNWLEKVEKLRALEKQDVFIDVRFREKSWKSGEIDKLKQLFSWLPESYLNFIETYDRVGIAFVDFHGSQKYGNFSLEEQIHEHHDLLKDEYFPFGNDADGSIFLLNTKGQILLWDKYDYSFEEEPDFIAESFEEFIGDCLLGERLGEFITPGKNSFYKTIQELGWV